ncbi:hypothetical protein [Citricoccus nitrophenolicus]
MKEQLQVMPEKLIAVPTGVGVNVAFMQKIIPHHASGILEFFEL